MQLNKYSCHLIYIKLQLIMNYSTNPAGCWNTCLFHGWSRISVVLHELRAHYNIQLIVNIQLKCDLPVKTSHWGLLSTGVLVRRLDCVPYEIMVATRHCTLKTYIFYKMKIYLVKNAAKLSLPSELLASSGASFARLHSPNLSIDMLQL